MSKTIKIDDEAHMIILAEKGRILLEEKKDKSTKDIASDLIKKGSRKF